MLNVEVWHLILSSFIAFQPKYYGGDYEKMVETLAGCKRTGTVFLVGGRNVDGVFKVCLHTRSFLFGSIMLFCIFVELNSSIIWQLHRCLKILKFQRSWETCLFQYRQRASAWISHRLKWGKIKEYKSQDNVVTWIVDENSVILQNFEAEYIAKKHKEK